MQVHHIVPESEGGDNTFENAVPVCLLCHDELGAYNPNHPIGSKFSAKEVKMRRDLLYSAVAKWAIAPDDVLTLPSSAMQREAIEIEEFRKVYGFSATPELREAVRAYDEKSKNTRRRNWLRQASPILTVDCADGLAVRVLRGDRIFLRYLPNVLAAYAALVICFSAWMGFKCNSAIVLGLLIAMLGIPVALLTAILVVCHDAPLAAIEIEKDLKKCSLRSTSA